MTHGFQTKKQAAQFEWIAKMGSMVKKKKAKLIHHKPVQALQQVHPRVQDYLHCLNLPQWTSKAPLALTVPLTVEWHQPAFKPVTPLPYLPTYVSERIRPVNAVFARPSNARKRKRSNQDEE
jgi:hypothetical protein